VADITQDISEMLWDRRIRGTVWQKSSGRIELWNRVYCFSSIDQLLLEPDECLQQHVDSR
jgi:hypothetical protein